MYSTKSPTATLEVYESSMHLVSSHTWSCQCISDGSNHLPPELRTQMIKASRMFSTNVQKQLLTWYVCRPRLPVAAECTREDICQPHPVFILLPEYILPALLGTGCWMRGRFIMTEVWLALCCQHTAEFCSLSKLLLTISWCIITFCVYAFLVWE